MSQTNSTKNMLLLYLVGSFIISVPRLFSGEPEYISALGLILIFNIKYLIYSVAVNWLSRRFKVISKPWYMTGYFIAIAFDTLFIYASTYTDANLAAVGLVAFTPWVFVVSLLLMVANTYFKRKNT